jgi:hypothetical protein
MTLLSFFSTQAWNAPSDCHNIDYVDAVAGGVASAAGAAADSVAGAGGAGGTGGGAGARAIKYTIPVTPGEAFTVYVGAAAAVGGNSGFSGLFSATRGWLCLANGASGSVGGVGGVGDHLANGGIGVPGTPPAGFSGGPGGNGGASEFGGNGIGGSGFDPNTGDGVPGTAATNYGSGGGGGDGGAGVIPLSGRSYVFGTGGAGANGFAGRTYISYTPYVPRPPTVTSLSKNIGRPGGGETITVNGTNFDNGVSSVRIGTINANSFTVVSPTQISAVTPQHVAGTFDVFVTNVDGTSPSTSADWFTFRVSGGGSNFAVGGR